MEHLFVTTFYSMSLAFHFKIKQLPEAGDESDLADEKDYTMNKQSVTQIIMGIDISKLKLDVSLKGKHYQYDNNNE